MILSVMALGSAPSAHSTHIGTSGVTCGTRCLPPPPPPSPPPPPPHPATPHPPPSCPQPSCPQPSCPLPPAPSLLPPAPYPLPPAPCPPAPSPPAPSPLSPCPQPPASLPPAPTIDHAVDAVNDGALYPQLVGQLEGSFAGGHPLSHSGRASLHACTDTTHSTRGSRAHKAAHTLQAIAPCPTCMSASFSPRPRRRPTVRFRLSSPVQVRMTSPMPARPPAAPSQCGYEAGQ